MSRGPELVARSCPNCGASLDAAPAGGRVVCHYCGHAFDVPVAAPPPPRVIVVSPRAVVRPVRRVQAFASFLGSMGVILGVVVAGFVASRNNGSASVIQVPGFPTVTMSGSSDGFLWDTVGGPPMPAPIGGGVEGFVGRIRTQGSDDLLVAGFDGTKLKPVWKVGPLGTYSQGSQATFTAVIGREVVVTDYRAVVHVYDVASGHELRKVTLTDRAKSMCTAPDGKPRVWVEVSDERNVVVDIDAATTTPMARPAWCPDRFAFNDCRGWTRRGPPRPSCRGAEAAPKVPGFEAVNVVEEEDFAVALGKRHPGTAVPMAVGFDPKTRAVRWQQPLSSGDPLSVAESSTLSVMDAVAGGRFVAPYQITSKAWHFTAFDARSGQRLWEVALQPLIGVDNPDGFGLSASRVYVMRTSSVEVYDAKTGALVGVVGTS
ncbi:MAG TPA: hypothetical protein VKU41_30050 [Polyangiaceae bacterium]|nr:hypothetical protein [Polyangiaceae bacterium]